MLHPFKISVLDSKAMRISTIFAECDRRYDDVWTAREGFNTEQLDATWTAIPAGRGSIEPGSDLIKGGTVALLVVPSVIVPEESAVMINAKHPDASDLRARSVRLFDYNRLFRGT